LRAIDAGAEISGHTFVDGMIYVLRGTEQNGESWTIAQLDLSEERPEMKDLATVSFACRSLTSMASISGRIIAPLTRLLHSRLEVIIFGQTVQDYY